MAGAARPRPRGGDVLEPLEDDEPGALAHDESVPVGVEGTGGEPGTAHVAAHRVQPHEAAHRAVVDQRVDATGQYQVGRPPAQQLHALTDGRGTGRAGGGHGHAGPLEAEPERQVGGDRARHDHRDGQRAHPPRSLPDEPRHLFLIRRRGAQPDAAHHRPPGRVRQPAALAERVGRSADGEGMGPIQPPYLGRREDGGRVEAGHPAHERRRPRRQPVVAEHLGRRAAGA